MAVKHLGNVIDIGDEAFPDRAPILGGYSKSNHAIKLRSEEIGVVVSAEELLEGVFLFGVEYKLLLAYVPEYLVIEE